MSKYSVSSTMEMPTTLTVMTRHSASLSEFHTYWDMDPARKKRMTARGSISPAAFLTVKMLVSVFRHGSSINPKKRYAKKTPPMICSILTGWKGFGRSVISRPPPRWARSS